MAVKIRFTILLFAISLSAGLILVQLGRLRGEYDRLAAQAARAVQPEGIRIPPPTAEKRAEMEREAIEVMDSIVRVPTPDELRALDRKGSQP
jgi:hypothetical protein